MPGRNMGAPGAPGGWGTIEGQLPLGVPEDQGVPGVMEQMGSPWLESPQMQGGSWREAVNEVEGGAPVNLGAPPPMAPPISIGWPGQRGRGPTAMAPPPMPAPAPGLLGGPGAFSLPAAPPPAVPPPPRASQKQRRRSGQAPARDLGSAMSGRGQASPGGFAGKFRRPGMGGPEHTLPKGKGRLGEQRLPSLTSQERPRPWVMNPIGMGGAV